MELPLLIKKPRLSLEMIDFQSDDFGADMELIFTEIQRKVVDNVYADSDDVEESKEIADLGKLIFSRFGLRVKLICNSATAAILPFYSNKNHIFLNEVFRGDFKIKGQEKILRQAHGKKGKVNTVKATVDGIFSEYENLLYLNFHTLFKTLKLSVPEGVAVTLHELGHAFYACEYSDRLETSNQVIQNVAQEITGKKDKADKVYIYREMKSVNPKVTEEEIEKLINGNRVVAGYTWFKMITGTVEEQLSNKKYTETSFEQLADNFAARFKYGRQLVLALDKLHTFAEDDVKAKSRMLVSQMREVLGFAFFALGSIAGITIFFPVSIVCATMAFIILRAGGEDWKDYTYDELKIRYKRVRNESIAHLKDLSIPNGQVKEILEDIYSIDRAIDETYRYNSLFSKISNFIFTNAREAKLSIVEQQLHEEFIHSDLYIASAQLRTLN